MKNYSSATTNYRAAGREYYQVDLFSFRVREIDTGDPHWVHFSNREYNETIEVRNQTSGDLEYRDYVGGGTIVGQDPLIRSEGTGVRNFSLVLSGTSTEVIDMVQGYDCRDAVFEWHIGEGEDNTGLLVDTPVCEFEGFVLEISRDDAGIQIDADEPADSTFTVTVTSHISTLQRANPDMRSHETGQDRAGDDIFRDVSAAPHIDVMWGKKGHRHKDGGGKGDGRDMPTDTRDTWGHR